MKIKKKRQEREEMKKRYKREIQREEKEREKEKKKKKIDHMCREKRGKERGKLLMLEKLIYPFSFNF